MKHKVCAAVLMTAVLGMAWGCGEAKVREGTEHPAVLKESPDDRTKAAGTEAGTEYEVCPEDADRLWETASLAGTVTEFSGEGCVITPVQSEGNLACQAAEGYEDDAEKNEILYGADCSFWIANVDAATARADYEEAGMEDVKKQTSLILVGDWQEDGRLLAEQVYIYRGKGGGR